MGPKSQVQVADVNKKFHRYLVYFMLYFVVNCLGSLLNMNKLYLLHNSNVSIQINCNNLQFLFYIILSLSKDIHFHRLRGISLSTSVKRFIKIIIGIDVHGAVIEIYFVGNHKKKLS